jgi:hypothetical protein
MKSPGNSQEMPMKVPWNSQWKFQQMILLGSPLAAEPRAWHRSSGPIHRQDSPSPVPSWSPPSSCGILGGTNRKMLDETINHDD